MSHLGRTWIARVGLGLALLFTGLAFLARANELYWAGVGAILVFAVALMVLEVSSPNPKDAPGPRLPTEADRKRWSEEPLEAPWPAHRLCPDCEGKKLCPVCEGRGGCDECRQRCWCARCGGAGQWPSDPTVAIWTPAPPEGPR